MNRFATFATIGFLVVTASIMFAQARPQYARQEGRPCGYCHLRPQGGGDRGFRGQFYGANGLSFLNFDEKREARIAGVVAESEGGSTAPAVSYNGNVAGPAVQQIQVAALRGPVLVVFLDKADEGSKQAVKSLAALAKALGPRAAVLGVARQPDALKLTEELGGVIRVYNDPDGAAAKKFSASQALDLAVAAKLGDPIKTLPGFSRANVEAAIQALGVPATGFDLKQLPEKALRGAKL